MTLALCVLADASVACLAAGGAESTQVPLPRLLGSVADNPALARQREAFIAAARSEAAQPIIRRPTTLDELFASRLTLKYRSRPAHMSKLSDEQWRVFCLSQGDNAAGSLLKVELPRLAAAAMLTGDATLFARVHAQLAELANWEPLERRGWSLSNSRPNFRGDDGAWLGTGWLVRAIVDTMELLPPDRIPKDLRTAIETRLAAELAAMERDWATKRPWYVRGQAAHSNQWILPNEALVRACLFLGVDAHRETYDAGVARLRRSMDVQGADGEFVEGLRYSGLSLESLYSIARATARSGDTRLIAHPFLRKFPTWLAHHFQPGGFLINAFDSPYSARGYLTRDQNLFAAAAIVTGSPQAIWALHTRAGFGDTLDGMLAADIPAASGAAPPLYANYAQATRLNWRSSWDDARATGLWIRGGHATDFHDHPDRGHVNFIIGKRALLIEAGTLNYAVPNNLTHLRGIAGHNVLQVGDTPPDRLTSEAAEREGQKLTAQTRAAPIALERLDVSGGAASVDVSACYPAVEKWRRRVEWTATAVTIEDDVVLKQPGVILFRWHLGVPDDAPRQTEADRIVAGDVALRYTGDQPLASRVESMPDATLVRDKISQHACVVLHTAQPARQLRLRTEVSLVASAGRK